MKIQSFRSLIFFILLCLQIAFSMSSASAQINLEREEGQVLVNDALTSETLSGMRVILGGHVAGVRDTLNNEASFEVLDQQLLDLEQLSELYVERLAVLLPENEEVILNNQKRLRQLIANLQKDFRDSSPQQIQASFNLLNQTVEEYFTLNEQLNSNRGIGPSPLNAQIPKDWVSPAIEVEGFRSRYKLQNGEQIIAAIEERMKTLRSASFKKFEDYHLPISAEMFELAQELRSRKSELPVPSQEPFLNYCLQLEVVAENARYYISENNRVAVRTQLQLGLKTTSAASAYFKLKNANAK